MDFSQEELEEILRIFQVESEEIVSRLNNSLVELEKKPNNKDLILSLFRDAHSLKGAARMVGFNNVQTITHKVEDILGLARDNKLQMNSKIADILYKSVDFISALIQASVQNKSEIADDNFEKQLSMLENLQALEEENISKENEDFNLDILKTNHEKVNELICNSLVCLIELESKYSDEFAAELTQNSEQLYKIFDSIGFFEIKMSAENIKEKLKVVQKASHSLNPAELSELQGEINNIIVNYSSICEINGLNVPDYYSKAFEQKDGMPEKNVKQVEATILDLAPPKKDDKEKASGAPFDLHRVREQIEMLAQKPELITDICKFFNEFLRENTNSEVNKIIEPISEIFDYVKKNNSSVEEDYILSVVQGIDFCSNALSGVEQENISDFIVQRLEIIKQLLEINFPQQVNFYTNNQDLKANKNITTDFSKLFEAEEIKTLRVDSQKLDSLVNQMDELIITKIKNKKHLSEIQRISSEIEEKQKGLSKILNHLKYYDRKVSQTFSQESQHYNFLIKQLINLSSDTNQELLRVNTEVSNLHRLIQEDDSKTENIIDEIESTIKNIRVLPLATVFHMFSRMVRDIAKEKNKKIELEIIGSQTCADKRIIEEIKTPLIHIIRNSIDHGIETPEARTALGKDATGKIILKAKHQGNTILIEVIDDGCGINIPKVREKALKKGVLTEQELKSLSDEEVMNLIFTPGFTTGDEITNISGRGIGLDVVQTKIAQLNGKVKVISEFNKGCKIQIELPITMATLKAFLVQVGGQTFAIPMSNVNTVLWKKTDEIKLNGQKRSIIFDSKSIPLHRLSEMLNLPNFETSSGRETVLVLENDNKLLGFSVEKLIGDQEILHKKLSAPLSKVKNISGITTLASGEICLILNVSDIMKTALAQESAKIHSSEKKQIKTKKETKNYKILVVDDSLTTRTLERNILTAAGFKTDSATNPLEAFELLKQSSYDLIITDIEMPEMNGFEFLQRLKSDEMYAEIPVIVVSSISSKENKKKAKELKASRYIVKGEFNQDEFLEFISDILF